ncbi:MAG: winged helix-turn-helix domain-containing protein [Burkholderiales bacterium]|nr:winged helix-turn-helix domain-containing protein [Burkholderiales bacterium]
MNDGQLAGLRRQALDVLLVLGGRAGQVVGKDELMQRVWPDVVVGEGSLTQAIADIRRALGDADHRLVRNVARRGYLLVPDGDAAAHPAAESARPEVGGAVAPDAAAPQPPDASVPSPATAPRSSSRRPTAPAIALAALVAFGLAVAWLAWRPAAASWQSPAELARAPRPREVPPLSIIVLPLAIEGEAKELEWFADALHGDLVLGVARMHKSLVIARDTAATYKGRTVDPRQVAREMGVRHVVSGSLRQDGQNILLNVALVDGETGVQQWAQSFRIDRAGLAQTVSDFATEIERTLVGELFRATAERRALLSPAEVTADDLAMQGLALWYRGVTRENVVGARALFERALAMDPDSVRAWAGIHYTGSNLLFNSWSADRQAVVRRSEEAVANLERLDRDGTWTYSAKMFQLFLKRDFPAALRLNLVWTERYQLPTAFASLGGAFNFNGRFDEAVPALERALRLGPRDPFRGETQYRLAMAHFGAGRYRLALEWSLAAAATNSALPWPPIHAAALHRLGKVDAAQQAFDEHMRRHPAFVASQIKPRLPSDEPGFAEARERLVTSLLALGMRP